MNRIDPRDYRISHTGLSTKTTDGESIGLRPPPPIMPQDPPPSRLPPDRTEEAIGWIWIGAVTHNSVTAAIKIEGDQEEIQLVVSPDLAFDDESKLIYSTVGRSASATYRFVVVTASGLAPDTRYYARVASGSTIRVYGRHASFKTFPEVGTAASFSFGVGSCSNNQLSAFSTGSIYNALTPLNPLFFLQIGDFFYEPQTNNVDGYALIVDTILSKSPGTQNLFQKAGVYYMWDDHDYGDNNGDKNSAWRPAGLEFYRKYVPHGTLAVPNDLTKPIYYSFNVGRCKFIITDLRSDRDPAAQTDNSVKSMMGATQKAWFKSELLAAKNAGCAAVFWVSTVPWIGAASAGADDWRGYATERTEISDYLSDQSIDNVIILSGDMHAYAFDDGSTVNYGSIGKIARVQVLHAAPLSNTSSIKAGPYWIGPYPTHSGKSTRQIGYLAVTDNGGSDVTVRFRILDSEGRVLTSHTRAPNDHTRPSGQRFAVIGDFGDGSGDSTAVAGMVDGFGISYVVTTGDNWYGTSLTTADLTNKVGNPYKKWIWPWHSGQGQLATVNGFYPAIGNHDRDPAGRLAVIKPYLNIPSDYYHFVRGDCHFFMYDSGYDNNQVNQQADGVGIGSTQANWLQAALAASSSRWKIVVIHHPPYSSCKSILTGPPAAGDGTLSYVDLRLPFKAWGADLVLSGHAHNYERLAVDDLPYIIMGASGNTLKGFVTPTPWYSQVRIMEYGALRCVATADQLKIEFVNTAAEVRDTLILNKDPAPPGLNVGLLAEYSFDEEIEGDFSEGINGYDVRLQGSMYNQLAGKNGLCYAVVGTTTSLRFINPAHEDAFSGLFTGDFSIAAWVKNPMGQSGNIFGRSLAGESLYSLWMQDDEWVKFSAYDDIGGQLGTVSGLFTLGSAVFNHVAVTFKFSTKQLALYVNGTLAESITLPGTPVDTFSWVTALGGGQFGPNLFYGSTSPDGMQIDELLIYKGRQLSPADVASLATGKYFPAF